MAYEVFHVATVEIARRNSLESTDCTTVHIGETRTCGEAGQVRSATRAAVLPPFLDGGNHHG